MLCKSSTIFQCQKWILPLSDSTCSAQSGLSGGDRSDSESNTLSPPGTSSDPGWGNSSDRIWALYFQSSLNWRKLILIHILIPPSEWHSGTIVYLQLRQNSDNCIMRIRIAKAIMEVLSVWLRLQQLNLFRTCSSLQETLLEGSQAWLWLKLAIPCLSTRRES